MKRLFLALAVFFAQASFADSLYHTGVQLQGRVPVLELYTNEWMPLTANAKNVRLVISATRAIVANVGYRVWRKLPASAQFEQVGEAGVLDFSAKEQVSKPFPVETGSRYVIVFQGEIHATETLLGRPPSKPMTLSVKLVDDQDEVIANYGRVELAAKAEFRKNIPGTPAYEMVPGIVDLPFALINGNIYFK
jgi:hypothetical protein